MKLLPVRSTMMAAVTLLALSTPVFAADMDNRIELSARQTHVFKTYLQGEDIRIQAKDGAVTLTGIVSDEYHKSLARETVAGLPGVTAVDNRLEIKGAAPTANSDAWLREKVKVTILLHRSVNTMTEVDVKDGLVTLRGVADNQAQKDLTSDYAMDVEGVKGVSNVMVVTPAPDKKQTIGEKIDDASITAQVKMTLLYHRSTSAINTKVETKGGEVTLYGKARSAAELTLASKLANDVHGVTKVTNRMVIE